MSLDHEKRGVPAQIVEHIDLAMDGPSPLPPEAVRELEKARALAQGLAEDVEFEDWCRRQARELA